MPLIPAAWEVEIGRSWFKASLDKMREPISKNGLGVVMHTFVILATWEG
jgi:hypothetical protein